MSVNLIIVSSLYTTPEGLFGELIITALVFLLIFFKNALKLIWKVFLSAGTTTSFPPCASVNTVYSVKKGANVSTSSFLLSSALNVEHSALAAP